MVKSLPLLFQTDMALAVWEGRKTKTRRIVDMGGMCPRKADKATKMQFALEEHETLKSAYPSPNGGWIFYTWDIHNDPQKEAIVNSFNDRRIEGVRCPYGRPGDQLWVKETWRTEIKYNLVKGIRYRAGDQFRAVPNNPDDLAIWQAANENRDDQERGTWRSSMFMPRWVSRMTLEIVSVGVERLHAITEEDAKAEGVTPAIGGVEPGWEYRFAFRDVWNRINKKRIPWEINPWVWVLEFKKI